MRKFYIDVVLAGLTIVMLLGGMLWFLVEQAPEPALAFVTGLLATFTWFFNYEESKAHEIVDETTDTLTDESVINEINVTPSSQIDCPLSEIDMRIVNELWQHVRYSKIYDLLVDGYANNYVLGRDLDNIDNYQICRYLPKYKLDDRRLEDAFADFDAKLYEVLSIGSIIFGPTRSESRVYKWNSFSFDISSYSYMEEQKKYENFVLEKVIPTWKAYLKIVGILEEYGVFKSLEWADK